MADETSKGNGFDSMRVVINLAALVLAAGTVALIVALIV